jgi:hypothetical protein
VPVTVLRIRFENEYVSIMNFIKICRNLEISKVEDFRLETESLAATTTFSRLRQVCGGPPG